MKSSFQFHAVLAALLIWLMPGELRAEDASAPAPATTNLAVQAAPAGHSSSNRIWGLWWDSGLHYELGSSRRLAWLMARHPDREVDPYHGKVGLKLQWDVADYKTDSDLEDIPMDSGIRRARLYTTGSFFLNVPMSYKAEIEIADQDFYVREAYLWMSEIPLIQTLKIGHFKAPMTLEGYTAAGDTLFLERAAPIEAFGPGIMFGIQPAGTSEDRRMTWAFGLFADGGGNDVAEASRSPTRFIGRVTWLPEYEEAAGKTKLIHLGVSGHYLYSNQRAVEFRSRPESYFAPRVVDTGTLDAGQAATWGIEFAAENGPLSLQSEFLRATVYRADSVDLGFYGCYVAGSWLITGENRPYNRNTGAFGHVVPLRKFSLRDRTFGACELVARLSHLDLDSNDVKAGKMSLATVGFNWYLNSQLRFMLDYALGRVDKDGRDGDLRILEGRVQYEF